MNVKHSDMSIPNKSERTQNTRFSVITTENLCVHYLYFAFHIYAFSFGCVVNFWSRVHDAPSVHHTVLCGLFGIWLLFAHSFSI